MSENSTNTDAVQALLGGAQRVRTRARGFAPWSPEKATLALLDRVQAVLDEYVDYLPLTIRQAPTITRRPSAPIRRLCEHLNRARPAAWTGAEQFVCNGSGDGEGIQ